MVRKALFKTPNSNDTTGPTVKSEALETYLKKADVDIGVENNYDSIKKELHANRINNMKQLLEDSKKDDWKSANFEDLIGF